MLIISMLRRQRVTAMLALITGLALAMPVAASHKVDHRYTVWGEVTYEDGTPAAGVVITLSVKDGVSLGETKTNDRGRYQVVLHIHNEDLYKVFDMEVAGVKRKVRILFNPADRQNERGQRIDFEIPRGS